MFTKGLIQESDTRNDVKERLGQANTELSFRRVLLEGQDPQITTTPVTLTISATFYNEAPYLREWIEFHMMQGVERFYLYNDSSTDAYMEELLPYLKEGIVELHDVIIKGPCVQESACTHAVFLHRSHAKWMAFIDLDEFFFSLQDESLPDLLNEFEDFPGVSVYQTIFGTSGHKEKPDGLVTENYTRSSFRAIREFGFEKCIVRTKTFQHFIKNSHSILHLHNEFPVNENKQLLFRPAMYHKGMPQPKKWKKGEEQRTSNRIRLNHYFTKSQSECSAKFKRGIAYPHQEPYVDTYMHRINYHSRREDTSILRFVPELKERLRKREDVDTTNMRVQSIPAPADMNLRWHQGTILLPEQFAVLYWFPGIAEKRLKEFCCSLLQITPDAENLFDSYGYPYLLRPILKMRFYSYLRFGFFRNPWERAAWLYECLQNNTLNAPQQDSLEEKLPIEDASFTEFIHTLCTNKDLQIHPCVRPQTWDLFQGYSDIQLDFVGRYERFNEDLERLCTLLEVQKPDTPLPVEDTVEDYRSHYDDETIALIAEKYKDDIEYLEYSFD